MNKAISIKLKATFLLIIFSLNMLVGFACAIGVDMGYNSISKHEGEATEISEHGDGDVQKHDHKKEAHKDIDKSKKDDCCDKEDNCCKNKVVKIIQTDKAVPQAAKLLNPVFFTAFVAVYYDLSTAYFSQIFTSTKYFVRGHHPPITDIRIAIQSFQI